jgi:hypothetical protein
MHLLVTREEEPMNTSIVEHFSILKDPWIERHTLGGYYFVGHLFSIEWSGRVEAIEEYGHAKSE